MAPDIGTQSPGPAATDTVGESFADPASWEGRGKDGPLPVSQARSRRVVLPIVAVVVLLMGGTGLFFAAKNGALHTAAAVTTDHSGPAVIPVNTIRPRQKTLERTLEQPGSIKPYAQAELYAKASGYLKTIQRMPTPSLIADLVGQGLVGMEPGVGGAARWATAAHCALARAPQKDIGCPVVAGELLLEIATPERTQEIIERKTKVAQREAELEAARKALATQDAAIQVAKALQVQAKADVRKYESEHTFRSREWNRLKGLLKTDVVTLEFVEEKENQVNAAFAAWESSKAKVQTAQAELAVVSSKFAAAQADITVKETLVQVAKDELRLAQLVEDYSRVYAPFDGIITYRDVDEGDFVQNSTTGQTRRLMTVTALDKVKVVLQVPDMYAPWVEVGTEATLAVNARTVKQVRGAVSRIASALDPQTRTMQVEIDLENPSRQLRPGTYGKVTMTLQKIPNAQAIPATAVYSRKGENFILEVQNGIARRQAVRIRFDDGKEMEVVRLVGNKETPLDGSEELIVSNKGEIRDGQRVKTSLLTISLAKPNWGRPTDRTVGQPFQAEPKLQQSGPPSQARKPDLQEMIHDRTNLALAAVAPQLRADFPELRRQPGRLPSLFAA